MQLEGGGFDGVHRSSVKAISSDAVTTFLYIHFIMCFGGIGKDYRLLLGSN